MRLTLAVVCFAMPLFAIAADAPPGPPPPGRTPGGGLTGERLDELAHRHAGHLGALAPANIAKPRPKAPFNVTGTWFVDLRRSFADFRFGPPYPEFYEPGQTAMRESEEARKKGVPYRDSIGQCYPAGMPMIMTRVVAHQHDPAAHRGVHEFRFHQQHAIHLHRWP